MGFLVTREPAIEPVTTDAVRQHLRIDLTDEDALLDRLIKTARQHVERAGDLAVIDQEQSHFLDRWPDHGIVEIPRGPVIAVTDILIHGAEGETTTVDPAHYIVDVTGVPARVLLRGSRVWPQPGRPANGIEVRLHLGFGASADDVPAPIKQAMLLLVGHWHATREAVADVGPNEEIPLSVETLLRPWRQVRL